MFLPKRERRKRITERHVGAYLRVPANLIILSVVGVFKKLQDTRAKPLLSSSTRVYIVWHGSSSHSHQSSTKARGHKYFIVMKDRHYDVKRKEELSTETAHHLKIHVLTTERNFLNHGEWQVIIRHQEANK